MALVDLQPVIENLSGSIDNITFAKTRSGQIAKEKSYPGKKNKKETTDAQLNNRAVFRPLPARWRTLKQQQRDGWYMLARTIKLVNIFNQNYSADGYHLYLSCNTNLQLIGQSIIDDPPKKNSVPLPPKSSLLIAGPAGQSFYIIFPGITTDSNTSYIIQATAGISAGINYVRFYVRNVSYIPPTTSNLYDFTTGYNNYYQFPGIGTKIFIKLIPVDIRSGLVGKSTSFYLIYTGITPTLGWELDESTLDDDTILI